jgi:phage shock protein PspC (stress-responsive transcriptional regulator)
MKKNITINLCGRLFQIDEDAYELLQQYIESLRQSFGREEGGEEIVNDIETRIAELFDELRQQGTEAITIEHVKDIITRIGKPEELTGEEEKSDNGGHKYDSFRTAAQGIRDNVRARTAGKRLYRNPNDKMVAGVLSGIAAYTGSDVTWWRIGYALLILASNFLFPLFGVWLKFGFFLHVNLAFILFYFVLAIAIPVADTPKQVLEMEGKEVTPQNLADVVVEDKQPAQHRRGCLGSFFSVIISIFVGIFVGIAAIVGLVLLVCLLLIIVSLVVIFTVPSVGMPLPFDLERLDLPILLDVQPWIVIVFIVGLLLALCIPLYAIAHMLFSRAGKVQPMGIGQRILWIVLWVASLCCLFPALVWIEEQEKVRYNERYGQTVTGSPWSHYSINDVPMIGEDFEYFSTNNWVMVKHNNTDDYYGSFTSAWEYYTGDSIPRYLHGQIGKRSQLVYQAEHTEWVEPGVYSLNCIVRADDRGTFVYTQVDGEKQLKEIPPYGDKGGELWLSITKALKENGKDMQELKNEPQWKQDEWHKIAKANHSRGFGWSSIQIDNLIVTADSIPIVYGVSTVPEFTGQPCRAKWFSATDFKLTRTGDLPKQNK